MIRKTGNRAFAALNRILSLPGTQALGHIDISVAQPVYDLKKVIQSSLSTDWAFILDDTVTAGTTQGSNINPWNPLGWSTIYRNGQAQANPDAIPETDDVFIWQLGVFIMGGSGNFTASWIERRLWSETAQTLMWRGRTLIDGNVVANTGAPDGAPPEVVPFPWVFTASMRAGVENLAISVADGGGSGDLDYHVMMRAFSAPPGLFSPLR